MPRDLSVIVAARNEAFLINTIEDVLKNSRANTEVIVLLDGYWPKDPVEQHEDVTIVHYEESIGQRAAVNAGVRLSTATYIMKLDAHCSVDEGFDVKLMADCEYTDTVVPVMYNLHAFDWVCPKCGKRTYQGGMPKQCVDEECNWDKGGFTKEIVWYAKPNPRSEFYRFDRDLKFNYWRKYKERPEAKGDIVETMSFIGACWFQYRERYWDLGGSDEGHGSWGQYGSEVACKTWFSGGRLVTNKKTWFAHLFRTGKGFGFPYPISGNAVKRARKHSQSMWMSDDGWPKGMRVPKVRDMKWLINHFDPVPDWEDFADKKDEPVKPATPKTAEPKTSSGLTKGIVYYTHNACQQRIMETCRKQLIRAAGDLPIVSISQYPVNLGVNFTVDLEPGVLSMFKQILAGLLEINTDIVFLAEHDILYHPSHFDLTPLTDDAYYYNYNIWKVDANTGQALHYDHMKQVSGLMGYRDLLVRHYAQRVERVEKEGWNRRIGYEPGKKFPTGIDDYPHKSLMSKYPNIDIGNHGTNLTSSRFKLSQYRCRNKIKDSFTLADSVPVWGETKGRFNQFLRSIHG